MGTQRTVRTIDRGTPLFSEAALNNGLALDWGDIDAVRPVKDIVFAGYSCLKTASRWICRDSTRPSAVVLVYHRVNDEFKDSVTTGVKLFDAHMAYLKRHWPVVPLRVLIDGEFVFKDDPVCVCITFDDGYRDNYDYAAPILLKHRLPATFFVSTGKLTDQRPFEHDLQKLGRGLPNMTWDQAREMMRDGFDFGSHTVNHVNLAQLPLDRVELELAESREALRFELGQEQFLFAYPFGRRSDMTPEVHALVRSAGYACCCSAYGGINAIPLDHFNILRIGVNFNFSVPVLRAYLHGWR